MTRRRLLIVDDGDLDRDLLVQIFEDAYELVLAADGETAIEAAATTQPDLILMDIGLPGSSGLDAVRAIRKRGTDVPIIAVSSYVMPGDEERALGCGCDDFVAKPIDDLHLVAMVERLLGEK
jgi:two-component system, cell cycle response regulator DivK